MTHREQLKQPDLSIIIPAYCEEKRIGSTLDALAGYLRDDPFLQSINIEVIVVVADAPDKTKEIVLSKQNLFRSNHYAVLSPGPRVGKGRDVKCGMLYAKGNIAMFMDADLATPLYHIREFYEVCSRGTDLVVGTRDLLRYRRSVMRNLFSHLGNLLYIAAGGVHVEDTQCGFKMFSQRATQICFSKLTLMGWGFDLEVLTIAKVNGLSIQALRITDWEDKPYSTYSDSPIRVTFRSIRDFLLVRTNSLRAQYREN